MMDEKDDRLTQRLQQMAPPPRDPLFRVKVLERRERQQFRTRVAILLSLILALGTALVMSAGASDGVSELARTIVLGVGLVTGVAIYVFAVARLLRRLVN